jgi:hypothetical protein
METVYDGVWLHDVFEKGLAFQGSELRGQALAGWCPCEVVQLRK